jgi:hypothetical protein
VSKWLLLLPFVLATTVWSDEFRPGEVGDGGSGSCTNEFVRAVNQGAAPSCDPVNADTDMTGTVLNSSVVTSSLTTVGALNAGSIATGFGAINTGADDVTTTGTVSGGALRSTVGASGLVLAAASGAGANPGTNDVRFYLREDVDQGAGTGTADCALVVRLTGGSEVLVQVVAVDGGC